MGQDALVIERGRLGVQSEPVNLAELFAERYGDMVRLAHLLTGSNAAAEELVQDAFIALQGRWDEVGDHRAYLRTTVVNRCRSWHRRRFVERRHSSPVSEPTYVDDVAELRDALGGLSPRQRAAVVLRFYEDMSEADIAAALGCRPGTVKSLLSRALVRLGEVIDR